MNESIFRRDGEYFVPSELARGPWSPEAQHGGAPAALLAAVIERFDGGDAMLVARMTIELLRPVPIAPLAVRCVVRRPGRKVQLVEASLLSGDVEVARCAALRIRRAEVPVPEVPSADQPLGPEHGVDSAPGWTRRVTYRAFHNAAVEHRFVHGGFDVPGPAIDWIRLRVPVIEGEPPSPLARVAAAADFGNGISAVLDRSDGYSFINPDLTIYVYRLPAGEWVCLDASTRLGPHGIGLAESLLRDEHGPIGRAVQSLLIER